MPGDQLAVLLRREGDVSECIGSVARAFVSFHASAARSSDIDRAGGAQALLSGWDDRFAQTSPFVGMVLDPGVERRVQELARRYLAGRAPLLERRMAEGHVCERLGDVQAEDIVCTDAGVRIVEPVTLEGRPRHADLLADLTFLAVDLEHLGAADASQQLLVAYQEISGARFPASLVHQYCASGAYVRTGLACLETREGDRFGARAARSLHELCCSHLEAGAVRLVLVGGLPGTGKSTLARSLADQSGATLLRSDEVRKRLVSGAPEPVTSAGSGYRRGLYRPEMTDATYARMLERARVALGLGEPVVLDASWTSADHRQAARAVATETSSEMVELVCVVDASEAQRRIERRRAKGEDLSDATAEVARAMTADADPWPSARQIDTSGTTRGALRQALEALFVSSGLTDGHRLDLPGGAGSGAASASRQRRT